MSLSHALALASVLVLAGLADAVAQFPPPPGFPPAPGQAAPPAAAPSSPPQSSPFPPPPRQSSAAPAQPGAFPAQPRQATPAPFAAPQAPNPFTPQPSNSVCEQFPTIRAQAEKDAAGIKAASDRKAAREEVCAAFNKFIGSEAKMVKFLETNQKSCGVPPEAVKQVKSAHARTQQIRKQVCTAPPGPRAPSLSDALGGPILSNEPPKPGRGTFDTLTGSPLSRDR